MPITGFEQTAYKIDGCTSNAGESLDVTILHGSDNGDVSLTMGVRPGLKVEWGSAGADFFVPIREAYATLEIVADATSDSFLSNLETANDGEYLMLIERDGNEIFRGFVNPNLGGRFQKKTTRVVIKAATGLELLKGKNFPTITDTRVTLLAFIDEALQEMGYDLPYTVDNNVYPDGVGSTADMLGSVYVNRSHFKQRTKDGQLAVRSCYDALADVMKRFGLTITQYAGRWFIQHWPQYESGNVKQFRYTTVLGADTPSTETAAQNVDYDGSTFRMIDEFPFIQRRRAYGTFDVTYVHGTAFDFWYNGGFSDTTSGWFDDWTKAGSNQGELEVAEEGIAPETPNEVEWNNNSLRINAYYDDVTIPSTPPAAVPYVYQDSYHTIDEYVPDGTDDDEWILRFTARAGTRWGGVYRNVPRRAFWRLRTQGGGASYVNYWRSAKSLGMPTKIQFDSTMVKTGFPANNHVALDEDLPLSSVEMQMIYRADSGATAPGGLTDGDLVIVQVTDNILYFYDRTITSAGSGDHWLELPGDGTWVGDSGDSYNYVELLPGETKQYEFKIRSWPDTDEYRIEFYGIVDHEVAPWLAHGGAGSFDSSDWIKPIGWDGSIFGWNDTDWGPPDIDYVLWDGVFLDDNTKRSTSIRTQLTSTERTLGYPGVQVTIGEGPWGWSKGALTTSSSQDWKDAPAENWDGLGLSDKGLDEWLLRTYSKFMGTPRTMKGMEFEYISAYGTPVDTLTVSSVRYYPAYFYLDLRRAVFGGEFLKITSGSNTVTVTEYENTTVYRINGPTGVTEYNGLSEISDNIGLAQNGELRLGEGTVGSNFTGIRIYKDILTDPLNPVYRVSGWDNEVLQAYLDSDGKLYAGGGDVRIDEDGIYVAGAVYEGYSPENTIDLGGTGLIYGATSGAEKGLVLASAGLTTNSVIIRGDGGVGIYTPAGNGNIVLQTSPTGSTSDIYITASSGDVNISGDNAFISVTTLDLGSTNIKDVDDSTGTTDQILKRKSTGGVYWGDESSGAFTGLTLAGDAGTPQAIADTNTITIAGGTGIDTSAGATDTVTVNITAGGVGTTQLADDGVTLAKMAHSTANHVLKFDGSGVPTTGEITTANLADDSVTVAKIDPDGAANDKVMGISGGNPAWIDSPDLTVIDLQTTGSTYDDMEIEGGSNYIGNGFVRSCFILMVCYLKSSLEP